jgi:hypothetical protein
MESIPCPHIFSTNEERAARVFVSPEAVGAPKYFVMWPVGGMNMRTMID